MPRQTPISSVMTTEVLTFSPDDQVADAMEQLMARGVDGAPVVDEDADVVTVVMLRNLGNRRLIPALFTIFTGIIFAVTAWMLHSRDRLAMQTRAEWDPASAT